VDREGSRDGADHETRGDEHHVEHHDVLAGERVEVAVPR
jgi:hypothetical protein